MRHIDSIRRTSAGDLTLTLRDELGSLDVQGREVLVAVERSLVVLDPAVLAAERGREVAAPVSWAAFGGRVLESGTEAAIRPGRRVCGIGPAAARVRCDDSALVTAPPGLDDISEPLAALTLALVETVRRGALELGESAAVAGRGILAASLVTMLARSGARVVAWSGAPAPGEEGADRGRARVVRGADIEVVQAAAPAGFDALFSVQQGTRALLESLPLLRDGGRAVAVAGEGPPLPEAADLYTHAHRRSLRLTAATLSGLLRGHALVEPRSLDLCHELWGDGLAPLRRIVTVDVRAGVTGLGLPIETEHLVTLAWHGANR